MKKALFICLLFAACKSNDNQLVTKAEDYLKSQLKDPSSYEPIESTIIDTTMLREHLTYSASMDSFDVERQIIQIRRDSLLGTFGERSQYDRERDSLDVVKLTKLKGIYEKSKADLQNLKGDSIHSIRVLFKYRAKNGFGALDKDQDKVIYYPSTNTFKTEKKD